MIIEIEPLLENFATHNLRVTNLEEFYSCPFKHKYAVSKFSNDESLMFGNIVHNMIQSYLYDKDKGRAGLEIICRQYPDYCQTINSYFSLIDEKCGHYNIILNEFKNIIEIHLGKHKIILEGTIDVICLNPDGTYSLVDIKTSKAERTDDTYNQKIQKYLYSYLFAQLVGRDKLKSFDYAIVTKHKKPRIQVISYEPDNQYISDFFISLLKNYIKSVESGVYKATKNPACRFCPLKGNGTCPAWNQQEKLF